MERKHSTGFTLLEILLVLAMGAALVGLSLPAGIRFYRSQQFSQTAFELVHVLRRAQWQAMMGQSDSSFGVRMEPSQFILFQGESYELRNALEDEVFSFPPFVKPGGLQEVVFSKKAGIPSQVGSIFVESDESTASITINSIGTINGP